jgi:hypothetical protein
MEAPAIEQVARPVSFRKYYSRLTPICRPDGGQSDDPHLDYSLRMRAPRVWGTNVFILSFIRRRARLSGV